MSEDELGKMTEKEKDEWIEKLIQSPLFKLASWSLEKQKKVKVEVHCGVELKSVDVFEVLLEGIRLQDIVSKHGLDKAWKKYIAKGEH